MSAAEGKPDRLSAFSDGVFAVAITLLAFELKPPKSVTFEALLSIWQPALGYAVSYLFIAIVWVNHHHLMRFADRATPRLIWGNFAHLFAVSLLPFATEWIANSKLASVPVAAYAAVFGLVNVTYLGLCMETVDRSARDIVPRGQSGTMRIRSLSTLLVFLAAAALALWHPAGGMALICLCLLVYLRPEAPWTQR